MSIHAQIIREHQISWYFFLKGLTPHNNGEVKDQVMNTFFALAETDREKVFRTLRNVRIHIVEPRPYTVNLHDALQKHLPKGTTVAYFLKRLDGSTKHLEPVRRTALEYIATRILRDAPGERLKLEYKAWEHANGLSLIPVDDSAYMDVPFQPAPQRFDLAPFEHRNANVLNDVANFVSGFRLGIHASN